PVNGSSYSTNGWNGGGGAIAGTPHDTGGAGLQSIPGNGLPVSTDKDFNPGPKKLNNSTEKFFTAAGTTSWSPSFSASFFPADGSYPVHVVTTDKAGNTNSATTSTFTIDNTVPAAPVITGIINDTGSSSSDGITSDTSLSVTGTAEADSRITVFDGAT